MDVKSGLVAITAEVLGDVQKEAEATILAAEKEAKKTLQQAKAQADQEYLALISQGIAKADAEKKRLASITEVELRNRLLEAKEQLVDAAFEKAVNRLKEFVETPKYQDYLVKLTGDIAQRIGAEHLVILVNAKDKAWLTPERISKLSKKLGIEFELSQQMGDFIGGCKIQTKDGKVTVDSTIDSRLQELKPSLRAQVAKMLFEEGT